MRKLFDQLPRLNSQASSDIAEAARHVESLSADDFDLDSSTGYDTLPRTGVDVPIDRESLEVIEEVNQWNSPADLERDEESYDGSVGGVVEGGIEYLAFYKSFRDVARAPARKRWGIFFLKRRCVAVAIDMSFSTGESFTDCLDALVAFLYMHELYHYRFDAHCLQMEATGGLAVYRPYRRLVSGRPMSEWHEESIANFYGLKALQSGPKMAYPKAVCDYLWDLVAYSPGAYSGGINKQQTVRRAQMAQQASAVFVNVGPNSWHRLLESTIRLGLGLSISREPTLGAFLRLDSCPVYWIDWVSGGKSVLVPYAASVAEVNNDFIKRYLAGVQDHQSDHRFYRIDNGEKIKLPNQHRTDLTDPEFHNIIGKAGMTTPQFYAERTRTYGWRKGVPRSPILPSRISPKYGPSKA